MTLHKFYLADRNKSADSKLLVSKYADLDKLKASSGDNLSLLSMRNGSKRASHSFDESDTVDEFTGLLVSTYRTSNPYESGGIE
jgi:hypothetical protein